MGKDLQTFLMAEVSSQHNVVRTSNYRVSGPGPTFTDEKMSGEIKQKAVKWRKGWFKVLRLDVIRFFWVGHNHWARSGPLYDERLGSHTL